MAAGFAPAPIPQTLAVARVALTFRSAAMPRALGLA